VLKVAAKYTVALRAYLVSFSSDTYISIAYSMKYEREEICKRREFEEFGLVRWRGRNNPEIKR
jgi:hypothetical protein